MLLRGKDDIVFEPFALATAMSWLCLSALLVCGAYSS